MQRKTIFILTVIVLPGMLFIGCNKEPDRQTPETFDSSIDGIAVQALPNIDLDLAKRILREGPVSSLSDVTDESVLEAVAAKTVGSPGEATASATTEMPDDLLDEDMTSDEFADDDPNFY